MRPLSAESVIANKNLVKGFLVPIFFSETGSGSALEREDFLKVRDGYACAKCLAEYVMYLATCPVCGHVRDLAKDLEDPDPLHVEHLRERARTEGMDTGVARGFDEFMADVNADPDVEQIPIDKLRKRRRK